MKKPNLFATLVLAAMVIGSSAFGEEGKASPAKKASPVSFKKRDDSTPPTKITSTTLEVDYHNYVALFDGKVSVKDPEFTLTCDKLLIFMTPPDEKKADDSAEGAVTSAKCSGNVHMVCGDIEARAGNAVYTRDDARVVLQDEPVVTKGKQKVTGQTITIWLNDGRVVVGGGVGVEAHTGSFKETAK